VAVANDAVRSTSANGLRQMLIIAAVSVAPVAPIRQPREENLVVTKVILLGK